MGNLKTIAEEDGYGIDFIVPPNTIELGRHGDLSISDYQHAGSPDGTYDVCTLEDQPVVLLFENNNFVYKKNIVEPYHAKPAVANNGTILVSGYTEGGYQDGEHLLKAWDVEGTEIFSTELRSLVNQITTTSDGRFAAVHTAEVLDKYRSGSGPKDAYDFSIYFIDLEQGQVLSRYTDQIPGIQVGGKNLQVWDIEFVKDDSTPLLALYETENASADLNKPVSRDAISEEVPLVDIDGNIVQYGRPDISKHPDHYELTDDAKERLGVAQSTEESADDDSIATEKGGEKSEAKNEASGESAINAKLKEHIGRIQSWSPSDQKGIDPAIESCIDEVIEILDEESPPLEQYPDISSTLFELTVNSIGIDPRQTADPSKLFEAWYSQHPQAAVEATAVERGLGRLEAMGSEVADLTQQYYNLPDYDDPDVNTVEVMQKTEQVQEELDELYYGAQALGRVISACVSDHGTVVVPFVSTGLSYLKTWMDEENPDSYDGPSGNAGLRKASAEILQELAKYNPPGLADELYENRQALYDLCPAPSDTTNTTPGNESKLIASTVLRLMAPLSDEYPDALKPILPSLIDNAGREYVFEALSNVAQGQPAQLVESFDKLDDAINRGRDFEPATGEVDYPDVVARLLQNAASEAPEQVWTAINDWLKTEQQPAPRVIRAMLEPIAGELTDEHVLEERKDALQTMVQHSDWQIRRLAVDILKDADDAELNALLEDLTSDPIPEVSDAAQDAIADQGQH